MRPSRRGRFQFRLYWLFLAPLLFAMVWYPLFGERMRKAAALAELERAAAKIHQLGGRFTGAVSCFAGPHAMNCMPTGREPFGLALQGSTVTDADLTLLRYWPELEELNLNLTSISDAGIAQLMRLKKLNVLGLAGTKITDAALAQLARLSNLKTLYLAQTRITDAGVQRLQHALPELSVRGWEDWRQDQLFANELGLVFVHQGSVIKRVSDLQAGRWLADVRKVVLSEVSLSDQDIAAIGLLPSLQNLRIWNATFSASRLSKIGGLKALCSLELSGVELKPDDLVEIAKIAQLEELLIPRCPSDQAIAALSALSRLKVLGISGGITDASLPYVGRLITLEDLRLGGTEVTGTGLPSLKTLSNLRRFRFSRIPSPTTDMSGLPYFPLLEELDLYSVRNVGFGLAGGLPKLRSLTLQDKEITDNDLAWIDESPNLRVLGLSGTSIGDRTLEKVSRLSMLETLDISATTVTDAGIAQLTGLLQLKYLSLSGTKVTAACLGHLTALTTLEHLSLGGTSMSGSALLQLAALTRLRGLTIPPTERSVVIKLKESLPGAWVDEN